MTRGGCTCAINYSTSYKLKMGVVCVGDFSVALNDMKKTVG